MRALVQRVSKARVLVEGEVVGEISRGLVVFVGVHQDDRHEDADLLARKVTQLRVFPDEENKMNLSVRDIVGSLLVVSQFTLYGETRKGNRPSYSQAAPPDRAKELYDEFTSSCRKSGLTVATGVFQAHMQVELVNEGPVTLWYDTESKQRW
jgi:D-tyrosyl-tRNA(Tyr) deacylase